MPVICGQRVKVAQVWCGASSFSGTKSY